MKIFNNKIRVVKKFHCKKMQNCIVKKFVVLLKENFIVKNIYPIRDLGPSNWPTLVLVMVVVIMLPVHSYAPAYPVDLAPNVMLPSPIFRIFSTFLSKLMKSSLTLCQVFTN